MEAKRVTPTQSFGSVRTMIVSVDWFSTRSV